MLPILEQLSKKKSNKNETQLPETIIGKETIFEGAIIKQAKSIRIDGTLHGEIELKEGTVIIGPSGRMNGNIKAQKVIIAGNVIGDITCLDTVELTSTAAVHGDIDTKILIVDEGAIIDGRCKVERKEPIHNTSKLPSHLGEIIPTRVDFEGEKK